MPPRSVLSVQASLVEKRDESTEFFPSSAADTSCRDREAGREVRDNIPLGNAGERRSTDMFGNSDFVVVWSVRVASDFEEERLAASNIEEGPRLGRKRRQSATLCKDR